MKQLSIAELQQTIVAFRDERGWQRFHQPRQLVAALQIECAELQEQLLWLSDDEVSQKLNEPSSREAIEDEMADVLAYLLCLAEQLDTSLQQALLRKLEKNRLKYPATEAFGKADKYTAYIKSTQK